METAIERAIEKKALKIALTTAAVVLLTVIFLARHSIHSVSDLAFYTGVPACFCFAWFLALVDAGRKNAGLTYGVGQVKQGYQILQAQRAAKR